MAGAPVETVVAREYPEARDGIFLNTASWGLLPRSSAREAAELTLRRNRPLGFSEREFGPIQRRCRRALASLLGVGEDEIALVPNTTYGVGLAAALVAAGEPGAVVTTAGEFPANVLPWKALEGRGFSVRLVPTDAKGLPVEDALVEALDAPDVRALSLSAVQYATGYRADLERLGGECRARGILFCVDAIQALGAVPLHPREAGIDVLASGGQKWLLGAWGSGFAWIARELHDRFPPPLPSWLGVEGGARLGGEAAYELDWVPGARRFEVATLGYQDFLALGRSVEVLLEIGVDAIERYLHSLHEPLLDWTDRSADVEPVTPRDTRRRAGILTFRHPRLEAARRGLDAAGVVYAVRDGALRLAPHIYNTAGQMEEVVRVLERARGRG